MRSINDNKLHTRMFCDGYTAKWTFTANKAEFKQHKIANIY